MTNFGIPVYMTGNTGEMRFGQHAIKLFAKITTPVIGNTFL